MTSSSFEGRFAGQKGRFRLFPVPTIEDAFESEWIQRSLGEFSPPFDKGACAHPGRGWFCSFEANSSQVCRNWLVKASQVLTAVQMGRGVVMPVSSDSQKPEGPIPSATT